MVRSLFCTLGVALVFATSSFAQNLLQNPGFEDNPAPLLGNNPSHSISPWTMSANPNVVKVDGSTNFDYGNNGPELDASGQSSGVQTHYVEAANNRQPSQLFQEFTAPCSREVSFGGYFSSRNNLADTGRVALLDASGSEIYATATTSIQGGNSKTDPWVLVSSTASLVGGASYTLKVELGDNPNFDEAFVSLDRDCDPAVEPEISIEKTCSPLTLTSAGYEAQCAVTLTYDTGMLDPTQVTITDSVFLSGAQAQTTLVGVNSADPWNCGTLPPTSDASSTSCVWNMSATPPAPAGLVTSTLTTDILIPAGTALNPEEDRNCVSASLYAVPAVEINTGENEVCAPLIYEDEEVPPEPLMCEAFTPTVECGDSGGYKVSLSNALSGTFDPSSIDVTVLTSGVTAQSHGTDPLSFFLNGATPGQTVKMSLASKEHGAGSEPGLDLCCMGEMEVVIPEGLVCEPPETSLEIVKTCEPTGDNAGPALGNALCFIDVTYSGPPPVAGVNDLIVTDVADPSEGVISFTGSHDPTGSGIDVWDCGSFVGATTATCKMNTSIDPTPTPGYWDSYSTTLALYLNTDDSYKNCASASITLADGSTVEAEDCHIEGDDPADLTIAKTALFETCSPGQTCQFEYSVRNAGPGDYSDQITLLETALTPAGGTIDSITPALCSDASSLLAGGCTGPVTIPANSSITYIVDYTAPTGLSFPEDGSPVVGANCVALDDTTLGQFEEPTEENGHLACADFEIAKPDLDIEKVANGECVPGAPCSFSINISTTGTPFSGRLAIAEFMQGQGAAITSMASTPPFSPACTPTSDIEGCVVDVALAANETFTLDVTAEITGYLQNSTDYNHNRNCVVVGLVADDAPLGSFDPTLGDPWLAAAVPLQDEEICVTFDPPSDPPEFELTKSCAIPGDRAPKPTDETLVQCDITLTQTAGGAFTDTIIVGDMPNIAGFDASVVFGHTCDAGMIGNGVDPLTCETDHAALSANGGSATMSVGLVFPAWNDMTEAQREGIANGQNCAAAEFADASDVAEEICVPINAPTFDDPEPPVVTAEKLCEPAREVETPALPVYEVDCQIVVTSTGELTAPYTVEDLLIGPDGQDSTNIMSILSDDTWSCPPMVPPPSANSPMACTINPADFPASNQSTLNVTMQFGSDDVSAGDWRNCLAGPVAGTEEGCVDLQFPVKAPELTVTKTCRQSEVAVVKGDPLNIVCNVNVKGANLPLGHEITVTDRLFGNGVPQVTNVSSSNPAFYGCTPQAMPTQHFLRCKVDPAVINAAGPAGVSSMITLTVANPLEANRMENCAFARYRNADLSEATSNVSCKPITVRPVEDEPVLPAPAPPYGIGKSCGAPFPFVHQGVSGYKSVCNLSLTVNGGPASGTLSIRDVLTPWNGTTARLLSGLVPSQAMNCPINPNGLEMVCTFNLAAISNGQSVQVISDVFIDDPQGDGSEQVTNCLSVLPNGGPICRDIFVPTPPPPSFDISKTCDSLGDGTKPGGRFCNIQISGQNLVPGQTLTLSENLLSSNALNPQLVGAFVGITPGWSCSQPAFSASNKPECSISTTDLIAQGGTSALFSQMVVTHDFLSGSNPQNCISPTLNGAPIAGEGCYVFPPYTPPVVEPNASVTKTCQMSQVSSGAGAPHQVTCDIQIDVTGPFTTDLEIMEGLNRQGAKNSRIVSVALPGATQCTPLPVADTDPVSCVINGANFPASLTNTMTVVMEFDPVADSGPGLAERWENCAFSLQTNQSCTNFNLPVVQRIAPPAGPQLEPFKAAKGACAVNKAAQTYTCAFEVGVKNVGEGAYAGPLVLDDTFGAPKPRSVKTLEGDGWECLRTDGLGTSCLNGSVDLPPGGASAVSMEVVIPGLRDGGTFENCVGVGIGDSTFLRASVIQSVMQKLGIDGGPVDGAPGRKTRAGVRQLQERLGLEPTGEIDNDTFAGLGIPSTEGVEPSCIKVDLPPMPAPEVTCKPGQQKNSRGVCYWPETDCPTGQVKNSKGQCYTPEKSCPSGQKLNSKGQCYTPRSRPSCDANSTVQQGDGCACRYNGMRKINASRCVCRNTGLPPIPGAGCPRIEINRGGDDGGPTGGSRCVTVNGIRLCT